MKIRSGFVSNSSSSSFIIAVPKDIKTVGTLQDYLFRSQKTIHSEWGSASYAVSDVAHRVFEDMLRTGQRTPEQLAEDFSHGWTEAYTDAEAKICQKYKVDQLYKIEDRQLYEKAWKELIAMRDKISLKIAKKFIKDNPGCVFYCLEYSDNDGEFDCTMEHAGIFDGIPHLTICMH